MQKRHKGVFFDPKRNRYRVRLYRGHKVVHLSYHRTEKEALAVFDQIKDNRPELKEPPPTTESSALLAFLQEG